MTTAFVVFFAFGAFFGLASWSRRHLFSEGHTRPGAGGADDGLGSRVVWVMLCSGLWPLMVLSGLYSAGHRARQRVRDAGRDRG